jgi:integrase
MSALIDRYWTHYGARSVRRPGEERSGWHRPNWAGCSSGRWTGRRGALVRKPHRHPRSVAGTAVRHFNVMHHMMEKASTIWSKETGIDRNPADQVEVKRPDDARDRYLSEDELRRLKQALDERSTGRAQKISTRRFPSEADCADRRTTGMRVGDLRALLVGRDVQRGAVGGEGEAEGRQDALRPDASRTRKRAAAVSRRDW